MDVVDHVDDNYSIIFFLIMLDEERDHDIEVLLLSKCV